MLFSLCEGCVWKAAGAGGRRVMPLLELDSPAGDTGVPGPGWGKQSEQHSPGCCSAAGWATRVPVLCCLVLYRAIPCAGVCHPVCQYHSAQCCTTHASSPRWVWRCRAVPAPHAGCQPCRASPARRVLHRAVPRRGGCGALEQVPSQPDGRSAASTC